MLEPDIKWKLKHHLETNDDYETLYDGSKKFNVLKSASVSKSQSASLSEGGTVPHASKQEVNDKIHNYIIT